jgi:hypothetical protein
MSYEPKRKTQWQLKIVWPKWKVRLVQNLAGIRDQAGNDSGASVVIQSAVTSNPWSIRDTFQDIPQILKSIDSTEPYTMSCPIICTYDKG